MSEIGWLFLLALAAVAFLMLQRYGASAARSRQRQMQSILPQKFVVADIETTGLYPDRNEIISIAAIRVNRDSTVHEVFTTLVKPSRRLPKRIIEITKLTDAQLEHDGVEPAQAIDEFMRFVGEERLVFYNAEFDMGFLSALAAANGRTIKNDVSCALKMIRKAVPGLRSYKLVHVAKAINHSPDKAHTALYDAELTVSVYAYAALKLGHP
jgi:DNA polymerase III epsilon subunit family exonuclease